MSHVPIVFQFQDNRSAALAFDTLSEIGYHVHQAEQRGYKIIQVFVDHSELTSALEIAQAHGGELLSEEDAHVEFEGDVAAVADYVDAGDGQLYDAAYGMDMVPIPAHLVNEDLAADSLYPDDTFASAAGDGVSAQSSSDFDPSGDDYDGFPAGVHI
jgi:hypothetical protein